jgi:hypothetical protein
MFIYVLILSKKIYIREFNSIKKVIDRIKSILKVILIFQKKK